MLSAVCRQPASLRKTEHRPWPLPSGPWVMGQTWLDLLFAHWPVDPGLLRPAVPPQVPIDTFDGSAWLGITPFEIVGLRARLTLPVPWLSSFLELNVRTYATIDGRPGIWFFSLDAARLAGVIAARQLYRLPYHHARMTLSRSGARVSYRSESAGPGRPRAVFDAVYGPIGPPSPPAPGTLEHFLTERYCLYTVDAQRRLHRADIHHAPWPLQPASAIVRENTMTAPYGIALPETEPLLHYTARQDVVIWPLKQVSAGAGAP